MTVSFQDKLDKYEGMAKVMLLVHRNLEKSENEAKTKHQTRSRQIGLFSGESLSYV